MRRHDNAKTKTPAFEQIIINRQNQQIESSLIIPNFDKTRSVAERAIYQADLMKKDTSRVDQYLYDIRGDMTYAVERFKIQMMKIMRAKQFSAWD